MPGKSFVLDNERFYKSELLERMCRVGIAHWGVDEAHKIAQLEQEIVELRTLNDYLIKVVKARRKQINELKRRTPTVKQKLWDETRIERTVFFLTSDISLDNAARMLGLTREALATTLSTSIKLLKRREAEMARQEQSMPLSETLITDTETIMTRLDDFLELDLTDEID